MTDDIEQVARRYIRYTAIGALVITVAWHLGYDLTMTVTGWPVFRWPELAAVAWLVHTAIAVIAALALTRDSRGPARVRELVVAALAVNVAVILACHPEDLLGPIDWGWGSVGWLGVVLLWNRPRWRAEAIAFLCANAGIMLAAMAVTGTLDRVSVAKYLVVMAGSATLQLGYMAGCHTLRSRAEDAVLLARSLAADDAWRTSARTIHADRLRRYAAIREVAESLLEQLADGADPGDPGVREDCTAGRHAPAPPHHRAGGPARRAGLDAAQADRRGRAAQGPGDGAAVRREPAGPAAGRTGRSAQSADPGAGRRQVAGPGRPCPRCPPW